MSGGEKWRVLCLGEESVGVVQQGFVSGGRKVLGLYSRVLCLGEESVGVYSSVLCL